MDSDGSDLTSLSHQQEGHVTSEPFKISICICLAAFTYLSISGNNQVIGERHTPLSDTVGGSKCRKHGKDWNRRETVYFGPRCCPFSVPGPTVTISLKAHRTVWPRSAFWRKVLETLPWPRLLQQGLVQTFRLYPPQRFQTPPQPTPLMAVHSESPAEPSLCTCLHASRPPKWQNQPRGRWDYRKWGNDNPRQGPFIQEKSPSSRHHGSAQSPLNKSKAGMLQRLSLLRNVTLCSPDMECSEPGKEGQVEGGGERKGKEERKARQRTT